MNENINQRILLPRRKFLQAAGFTFASLSMGGCASSLFEDEIGKATEPFNQTLEQALFNKHKLSSFPKNAIEPNALLINTAEDETPNISEGEYRLELGGLVDRPVILSMKEIKALPYESTIVRHVCVEGWAAIVQWGGVPIYHLAKLCGAREQVKYVSFASSGNTYYETWDIASSLHPQTILAYQKNFEPLPANNGGPLRLASPIKLGYKLSKWVTKVEFLKELPDKKGYWEDQGYEWYAGI